jgi:hypothetical protein
MEDVGIGTYSMDTCSILQFFCYILSTFGVVRGNLVYFSPFWYFVRRKIWQPRKADRLGRTKGINLLIRSVTANFYDPTKAARKGVASLHISADLTQN